MTSKEFWDLVAWTFGERVEWVPQGTDEVVPEDHTVEIPGVAMLATTKFEVVGPAMICGIGFSARPRTNVRIVDAAHENRVVLNISCRGCELDLFVPDGSRYVLWSPANIPHIFRLGIPK